MEHYKVRLVGKNFTQEYDINYKETFALVTRITLVRSLITVTNTHQN